MYVLYDPQEPWFAVAAIEVASSFEAYRQDQCPPFYWLRFGEPDTESEGPSICLSTVSLLQNSTIEDLLLPRSKSIEEKRNGTVNYDLIRAWLNICRSDHADSCGQSLRFKRQMLDIKLIDVHHRVVVHGDQNSRYVTLSYVSGRRTSKSVFVDDQEQQMLHLDTVAQLPERLPQTIEDAICVTRSVGRSYLWVDIICIDQSNQAELQSQINSMDLIYECSDLTIIALDGQCANSGLAGVSRRLENSDQPTLATPNGVYMATFVEDVWSTQGTAKWDYRAWTFQEGLLSRRSLLFDKHHVRMRCKKAMFHDLLPVNPIKVKHEEGSAKDVTISHIPMDQSDRFFWENGWALDLDHKVYTMVTFDALMANYSRRELTKQHDALNACKGALSKITRNTGGAFVWALPVVWMNQALGWVAYHENYIQRREGFPSWSWLGWKGRTECGYWMSEVGSYEDEIKAKYEGREKEEPTGVSDWMSLARELVRRNDEAVIDLYPDGRIGLQHEQGPGQDHRIRLSSTRVQVELKLVRANGAHIPSHRRKEDSAQSSIAVGDHWTILDKQGRPLVNSVSEFTHFENTDYFLRLAPKESAQLKALAGSAQLVLLKHYLAIRDHHSSDNWRFDIIHALVLIRNKADDALMRLAAVTLRLDDWIGLEPEGAVVEIQ